MRYLIIGLGIYGTNLAKDLTDLGHEVIGADIKAIWNFTPYRICAPEGVVISNTSIYAHLAVMYNRMS